MCQPGAPCATCEKESKLDLMFESLAGLLYENNQRLKFLVPNEPPFSVQYNSTGTSAQNIYANDGLTRRVFRNISVSCVTAVVVTFNLTGPFQPPGGGTQVLCMSIGPNSGDMPTAPFSIVIPPTCILTMTTATSVSGLCVNANIDSYPTIGDKRSSRSFFE